MRPFQIMLLALLLAEAVCISGCMPSRTAPTVPTTEATEEVTEPETEPDPRLTTEKLNMVVTELTISELEEYPMLREADLSGSSCYTAMVVYAKNHPEVNVTFTVELGLAMPDNWSTELELEDYEVDYDLLERNLVYLPLVQSVHLVKTSLTAEQIAKLQEEYPDIVFTYTVDLMGHEVDADTEEMNLAGLQSENVAAAAEALGRMRGLNSVELMNADGSCALNKQDVKKLVDAAPGVKFHYEFELFGKRISTTDKKVEYKNLSLTEECENELRSALAIMSGCDTFVLDECGLGSDFLASVRADYEKPQLVWRVYFGTDRRYPYLTNAEAIRAVYNVTDETCHNLRYCTGVKYIDMGHNDYLTDASFVGYLPDLEILILSGSAISDLSGFENCKKLEFLELANCAKITDISPLAGCSNLKYLNICYTKVKNLMPLDGLPMELLFCKRTQVPADEQNTFKQVHENCIATFTGKDPYAGPGWRYVDNGKTYTEIYKKVRQVFKLDEADKLIAAGAK